VFEITPDTIARRGAESNETGLVRCTNHFRTNGMSTGETCWRFDRLGEVIARRVTIDVKTVEWALDRVNQGEDTLQSMVFEPRELVLHLAIGEPPVSGGPYTRIELEPLFSAAADAASK
jgi:hypothetical protein